MKRFFIFILVAAASAALTSFILVAASASVRIQTSRAPFLNRMFSFFVNTSMVTKIGTGSFNVNTAGPSPAPTAPVQAPVRQPVPKGFKGPTGPPHVNGPTSNPPNY